MIADITMPSILKYYMIAEINHTEYLFSLQVPSLPTAKRKEIQLVLSFV